MRRFLRATVVLCLLIAGCGGDDDDGLDSGDPRTVVATYLEALDEEDASTACEVIAGEYGVKPQRCEDSLTRGFERLDPPDDFDADEDLGEVSFRGESAARVEIVDTGGYVDLVKEDGEWRIQLSD